MPQYLREYKLLLWITILWLTIKHNNTEDIKYGMRIQRPKENIPPFIAGPECTSCINKVSENKSNPQTKKENVRMINRKDDNISAKNAKTFHQNSYNIKPLIKTQQISSPRYSNLPKENERGATFFFTQVEPHRFEYRAMFQHHRNAFHDRNNVFQPFVNHFEPFSKDFPPLPKFPSFPEFTEFFHDHKDPFANFPEFSFPTLPPNIKRIWQPSPEVQTQRPPLNENFDGPLVKKYDVVLGHTRYPKIFRFNEERINIEDFDRQKKLKYYKLSTSDQNELHEPENVKRDQLLILHGGVFTVQEPPLFNKRVKKTRKQSIFL